MNKIIIILIIICSKNKNIIINYKGNFKSQQISKIKHCIAEKQLLLLFTVTIPVKNLQSQ